MSHENPPYIEILYQVTSVSGSHIWFLIAIHRTEFKRPSATKEVQELSVDGGKIRIRTPVGEPCSWRDYKGVRLHEQGTQAFFQDNPALVDWVNYQPLAEIVTCVGDGHDGIWNIISQLAPNKKRREIQGLAII